MSLPKFKRIVRNVRFPNSKDSSSLDNSSHNLVKVFWSCEFYAPVKDILSKGNARILDVA
jgi:hypothetical protein